MFSKLLVLFLLVPLAELAVFYWLGSRLGLGATLVIILLTGVLGAALTKSQGLRVLREFRATTAAGHLPHGQIIEGLMILIAGALLLTPGFLTDTVGFLVLIPAVRRRVREKLTQSLSQRFQVVTASAGPSAEPTQRPAKGKVIDV